MGDENTKIWWVHLGLLLRDGGWTDYWFPAADHEAAHKQHETLDTLLSGDWEKIELSGWSRRNAYARGTDTILRLTREAYLGHSLAILEPK